MPVKKRTLLESLSKAALTEFARGYDLSGFSTMSKPELVDALAAMRSLPVAEVLESLSRDELKAACEAAGLDTSGREKATLIERLLGDGIAPDGAEDSREKFTLKSDPAPDPKIAFGKKSKASTKAAVPKDAESRRSGKRVIEQYQHTAAERLNNPPAGLVTPESDPVTPAPGAKARKQYQYDPNLDPTLQWAGKAERMSFDVDTVSLHVHERIDPKTILEAVKAKNGSHEVQPGLFGTARENPPLREAIDFYKHSHGWSNRLIAGDSLLVMNSLLEKEGMAGKVQMVYFDPPYGITYGSNFMPFVNKQNVKDRVDEDLTKEPEMLKAFRDTWELGIHSYLTYLRDRLTLAHAMLDRTGSCFVQISDANLHHVREVMDEVFGPKNFMVTIFLRKKGSQRGNEIRPINDHLVWYCRDRDAKRVQMLYDSKLDAEDLSDEFQFVEMPDHTDVPIGEFTTDELAACMAAGARLYVPEPLTSGGEYPTQMYPVTAAGRTFRPPPNNCWKFSEEGMGRIAKAGRIHVGKNQIRFKKYHTDFPYKALTNLWADLAGASDKIYVVQTATKAIQRCILMTTRPGDLVLDITCGSGTTALVAEQWGRRWITCDTSRVAMTLAKQRMMTSVFDYYELAHPDQGIRSGFVFDTIPHITSTTIANALAPIPETMHDKPHSDANRTRVAGPFTVEAVPAPVVKPVSDLEADADAKARDVGEATTSIARDGETLRQAQWRSELLKTGARGERGMALGFTRVEPMAGAKYLHALAEVRDKGGFRNKTWKAGETVAICFGPEHAPLEQRVVQLAWEEARELKPRPAVLLFAAFAFDPEAQKDIDEMDAGKTGMLFLRAGMNDDLTTEDLKKKRGSNESFWLIGQPEIALRRVASGADVGRFSVEVQGFDYFDPKKGTVQSGGTDRIAMWMLDPDYDGRSVLPRQVFFPMAGPKDGWSRLGASLRAEIDQEKIEAYRGVKSLPFDAGKFGRVAVKIVDDRGIESLVVRRLDEAEGVASGGAKK